MALEAAMIGHLMGLRERGQHPKDLLRVVMSLRESEVGAGYGNVRQRMVLQANQTYRERRLELGCEVKTRPHGTQEPRVERMRAAD